MMKASCSTIYRSHPSQNPTPIKKWRHSRQDPPEVVGPKFENPIKIKIHDAYIYGRHNSTESEVGGQSVNRRRGSGIIDGRSNGVGGFRLGPITAKRRLIVALFIRSGHRLYFTILFCF